MRSIFFAVGLAVAAVGSPVAAADTSGSFAVDGIGVRSCADFTRIRDNREAVRAFAAWTDGFFTAYNVLQDDTFDITPWQTVELTIAKMFVVCEANPELRYIRALGKLIGAMTAQRLTEQDQLVSARFGGKSVFIYGSMLERVRASLLDAGYALAQSDVPFDDDFAQALIKYQTDKQLTPSGLPDLATLNALYP